MLEVIILLIVLTFLTGLFRLRFVAWAGVSAVILLLWSVIGFSSSFEKTLLWIIYGLIVAFFILSPLRQQFFTKRILRRFQKVLPKISATEEEALNAGDKWLEAPIFQGNLDWQRFQSFQTASLTEAEQAFLEQETTELCRMIDDWQATFYDKDLPPEVWQYMRNKGFFGLVIDSQYGGKGFSAYAHSCIVLKVASKSVSAGVTVMVPNSLGPGELLEHYGTEEQKQAFLPRLARGEEIPCFALTGLEAGSDAVSIPDTGVVCRGEYQGQQVLGIRLNFDKRYITLAPVATLVGLAFVLSDPEQLLGEQTEIGITCALVPANHPGVEIGNRGLPLDQCFMNGTVRGQDVFIPIDWIIGGQERAGQGWKMLVESLSIGRSISLPACATATGAVCFTTTGAYALIREQFNTAIGQFEGIEEKLARIGGFSFLLEATRRFTVTAVDRGIRPATASAIAKYHMTEISRLIINDAMDVHGGKAIIMGPRNYLARAYQGVPIGITVEGANILTRNLMIFGQGAISSHPFLRDLIFAAREQNLSEFDQCLFGYSGHLFKNLCQALFHGLTAGKLVRTSEDTLKIYRQRVSRLSASFSLSADVALLMLGGSLKRRERLSARLGDVMSYLYMALAVLKYHDEHEGDSEIFAKWALEYCLYQAQTALNTFYDHFPKRSVAWTLRRFSFFWGLPFKAPSDRLDHEVAQAMMEDSPFRQRLNKIAYVPNDDTDPVGRVERAFRLRLAVAPLLKKLKKAAKEGKIAKTNLSAQIEALQQWQHKGQEVILTAEQIQELKHYDQARKEVLLVDEFPT